MIMAGLVLREVCRMDERWSQPYIEKRSAGMAVASLVMGIVGIALSCCIYPAFVFGSLAVIFALLSRGGERKTGGYGQAGLILGILALVCGLLFLIYGILAIYAEFGGFEEYLRYMEELMQGFGNSDSGMSYPEPYSNPYVDPYSFFEGF